MGRGRVGLIVNPVAGLGGRVGLKGSDGAAIQAQAMALGAMPQAHARAMQAVERLRSISALEIVTYPAEMGEEVARACQFVPRVIGSIRPGRTTPQDTQDAARMMKGMGVDLLLFAGGDGTARDIYAAIGRGQPVLGIPAGVKIHSAVYGTSPVGAGELARLFLEGRVSAFRESEVMDIDEEAFRQGVLSARLYGYLMVPHRTRFVQTLKVPNAGEAASLASIAAEILDRMEDGVLYIVGPGTTTRAILKALGLEKTLLGVDAVLDRELLARDVNETGLLALLRERGEGRARIIVTPIGGQGYLFGRGNQQISPSVIRRVGRENVLIVSTPDKLHALQGRALLVDSGDRTVDQMLCGYVRVVTGYNERAIHRVSC
jgi:predicted polyphosphate/ATP-dependent NAD kinase